jgi:hypothetical protein
MLVLYYKLFDLHLNGMANIVLDQLIILLVYLHGQLIDDGVDVDEYVVVVVVECFVVASLQLQLVLRQDYFYRFVIIDLLNVVVDVNIYKVVLF